MKNKIIFITLLAALCLTGCSAPDPLKEQPTLPGEPISSQASDEGESVVSSSSAEAAQDDSLQFLLTIPEGFTETDMEGFALFYTSENGSSINLNLQEKDDSFASLTADVIRTTITDAYKQAFDIDIELTDNYFNLTTLDGFPAYQYSFHYEMEGRQISQLIVGIDGDSTYTFTFTDSTGSYMELFESCAAGIHASR